MVVEQVNSALMQLILGVLETMITQDGVDIFFPNPRSIKEDSADFVAAFTIFNLFHSEDLEAERLEWAILSIIWVNLCTEILADTPDGQRPDAVLHHIVVYLVTAVGDFGSHLRIVLLVVQVRIEVLLLHFQAAGVDGLADLAVVGLNMNEFVLLRKSLFRLPVQAGLPWPDPFPVQRGCR